MVCDKAVCERWYVKDLCVTKCHTANPVPQAPRLPRIEGQCHQAPRLPRKEKANVTKRHACHAKWRGTPGDPARPKAPPEPAQCPKCPACHVKRRWMSPSATHSTRSEGGCYQAPRLPRKTKVDVTKCQACHAKRRSLWQSAMPATQSAAASPATNRAQARPSAPPDSAQCRKYHACHAKRR